MAEKSSKTDRSRKIALDLVDPALLKRHQLQIATWVTEAGGELRPEAFVFSPIVEGTIPYRLDSVTSFFIRGREAIGAPTVRLHDLRPFTATQLIGAEVDVRRVADFLGHSDLSLTLRVCSHAIAERNHAAAAIMAGAFGHNEVQVQETRSTVRWLTEQTATMARGDVDHDHEEVVDEDREEEAPELPFEIIVGVVSMILQDWWNQHSDALLEAERVAEWLHFRIEQPVHRLTMTVEEAGQALGMSRATVYEAVGRGEILCIRIGRRILIQWMAPERAKQPSHNQQ